ncbi:MAG: hypothetical protein PUF09_04630 [Bacteroidales bacterium]|nr:hypothetical protein [Bacteroidales bacterium]
MQEVFLNTIQDFNDYQGVETLHPLVSVVHVENTEHIKECVMHYGFYAIYLKENKGCKLSYGRTPYDFDEMTVTSFAPGQVVKVESNPDVPFARFTALVFHPDLLSRTALGKQMSRYEFFGYFQYGGFASLCPRGGRLSRCARHNRAGTAPLH